MLLYRRLREAQTAFEQAIDLDYRPAAPFTGLGYVLLARRQRTEAIQMLHEVRLSRQDSLPCADQIESGQALARTPGEPIASELLSLAIQDQTESMFQATSKSGVVRFPYLSDQTAVRISEKIRSGYIC